MRQATIQKVIPRLMYASLFKRFVPNLAAGYGLTGDRRHRHKRLGFSASICETSRRATEALEKAMSRDVIATCEEIDAEIVRVLTEKFSWEQRQAASALQSILARGVRVKIRGTVKVCRDPNDDMFLECATLAKADLLVAGDKDLLILGAYKGTRIVSPSEYLRAG
jgi:uncharacterized protein